MPTCCLNSQTAVEWRQASAVAWLAEQPSVAALASVVAWLVEQPFAAASVSAVAWQAEQPSAVASASVAVVLAFAERQRFSTAALP